MLSAKVVNNRLEKKQPTFLWLGEVVDDNADAKNQFQNVDVVVAAYPREVYNHKTAQNERALYLDLICARRRGVARCLFAKVIEVWAKTRGFVLLALRAATTGLLPVYSRWGLSAGTQRQHEVQARSVLGVCSVEGA